jgi:hypothetical protein
VSEMRSLGIAGAALALLLLAVQPAFAQPAGRSADGQRLITQGLATTATENLFRCGVPVSSHRISAVGTIRASDGTTLAVPARTQYGSAPQLPELFNECSGVTPRTLAEVNLDAVPIVEIDSDGEVVTGYIIADNHYELYVNGRLIGVGPIPFTPFNSQVVRFRARRPYTYALYLVDWEEKLGLGMERMPSNEWHAGDGGIIARFSDGAVTDGSWRAQSFYIAPLAHPDDVVENGPLHDVSRLGRVHPQASVHYPVPANWMDPDFDDSGWPRAFEYTDDDIGVTTLTGYLRYPEALAGARWIWTVNLVFDNLVIARRTVR